MDQMRCADYRTGAGSSLKEPPVSSQEVVKGVFAEKMAEKYASSTADMTPGEYKLYIYEKIDAMYLHPSQRRVFWYVDITEAAWQRMQFDPEYEQKVLDYIQKNRAVNYGCHVPQFILIHIEESWDKCYGYSMGVQDNDRCRQAARARRREAAERAKRERRKKLLKDYLKRKAQQKRLLDKYLAEQYARHRLERNRMARIWSREKQLVQAARAYEASLIMLGRREQERLQL